MRIPFKIDTYEFTFATSYEEMTTGEFFALRNSKENNLPSMLSALSGVPEMVWDNVDVESVNVLFKEDSTGWFPLQYLYEKFDWDKMPLPNEIDIDGKKIKVGAFFPTLKQKHLIDKAIDNAAKNKDHIDSAIEVLAIYYQHIVTGKEFSIEASNEFQSKIKETKIVEAFPLATFFLAKSLGLESVMQSSWLTKALRKKLVQESKSLKRLEYSTQSTNSQGATPSNTNRFGTYLTKLFSQNFGKTKSRQILERSTEKY